MRIVDINRFPFGTVLSLSEDVPSDVIGGYLSADGTTLYKVKGTPSNIWTEVLLEGDADLKIGQEITFLKPIA